MFLNIAQSCMSTYFVAIRPKDKPWYNSEIRKTSRQKDKHRNIAQVSEKSTDWLTFKKLPIKVNNMKKHTKVCYFNNLEFTISDVSRTNPREN